MSKDRCAWRTPRASTGTMADAAQTAWPERTALGLGVRWWCALGLWAALSGCANVMRVDSDVQSYARWTPPNPPNEPAVYGFERTPSQSAASTAHPQASAEAATREALATRGWRWTPEAEDPNRRPANAWRVQVLASAVAMTRPSWDAMDDPFWPSHRRRPGQLRRSPMLFTEPTLYRRQVTIWVRDSARGDVVFESSATHEGPWNDSPALWRAMVEAALSGFPQPPSGPRRVVVDVPR